jgi:phosphate starvation-inducible PhoH-like protein
MRSNKTRKQVRNQNQQIDNILNKKFAMKKITPLTETQSDLFDAYSEGKMIAALGSAGTGKTYTALFLALQDVMQKDLYDKIIIVRSAVQGREQGFMPGTVTEKAAYYELPYIDIVNDLCDRGDAYQILKHKKQIEFVTTSFLRGLSFDNTIIIFDECQNADYDELRTVITRVGKNTKILFCGDTKQDDLRRTKNRNDVSGLSKFVAVLEKMDDFELVEFTSEDIVRSGIVREFIMAEELIAANAKE